MLSNYIRGILDSIPLQFDIKYKYTKSLGEFLRNKPRVKLYRDKITIILPVPPENITMEDVEKEVLTVEEYKREKYREWLINLQKVWNKENIIEGDFLHELWHIIRGDLLEMTKLKNKKECTAFNIAADAFINRNLTSYPHINIIGVTFNKLYNDWGLPESYGPWSTTKEVYEWIINNIEFKNSSDDDDDDEVDMQKSKNNEGGYKDKYEINVSEGELLDIITKVRKGFTAYKSEPIKITKPAPIPKELKEALKIRAKLRSLLHYIYRDVGERKGVDKSGMVYPKSIPMSKEKDIAIYVDISGSIGTYVIPLLEGMRKVEGVKLYTFSDTIEEYKKNKEYIQGGTMGSLIPDHAKEHGHRQIVVISDFELDIPVEVFKYKLEQNKVRYHFIKINA